MGAIDIPLFDFAKCLGTSQVNTLITSQPFRDTEREGGGANALVLLLQNEPTFLPHGCSFQRLSWTLRSPSDAQGVEDCPVTGRLVYLEDHSQQLVAVQGLVSIQ
jgi:hypothetical protein